MSKIKQMISKQMNGFSLIVFFFWLKTYLAYWIEFNLGVSGLIQQFILLINPLAVVIVLFSTALYFKKTKYAHFILLGIVIITSINLYANILYYREFSDFLTANILIGSNNVSGALVASTLAMMRPWDLVYWLDVVFLLFVIFSKRAQRFKIINQNRNKKEVIAITLLGAALFVGNLTMAEIDRPQLLTRTFDRNYVVKYLGLNFFTGYDAVQTLQSNQLRASADESNLVKIVDYANEKHAEPNPEYFGLAEDRNVIVIALESVQEFLIDYELEDEYGVKHEVMPFVNSLFNSSSSYSFENFFHQTGQGKSADGEILAEASLYGLAQGSVFQTLGSTNTFHATPNILKQEAGYTSAAFHGNVGSFWNRTDTYRQFGYDYFFDADFFDVSGERSLEYGLKDKLFFHDSAEYLEQLPQPFYSKFITVTHHFPYPLDEPNAGFPTAQTADETINSYFATANYADQAIEEFFNYLKETGLYENSIFVLYGDHYGISNMRNPHLAPLIGEDPEEWGDLDNVNMQRVPLIVHVPGVDNGFVSDTYSGQVDMLPTLMHLLGLETDDYLFMGQDLLSDDNNNSVTLRNGRVITPEYTFFDQVIYDNETGEEIQENLSEEELLELLAIRDEARKELSYSDDILMMDLLRFYSPPALRDVSPLEYLYRDQLDNLYNHPQYETSLLGQRDGETTTDLYITDAPEITDDDLMMEDSEIDDPQHYIPLD